MKAPIFIGSVELTEPVTGLELPVRADGAAYTQVRLLVRMQAIPVGYALLRPEALDAGSAASQVWAQLGPAVNARRAARGLAPLGALPVQGIERDVSLVPELTEYPLVSVVMCTRDRPAGALVTLRGLAALRYEPFEIVVVDNAPNSDATQMAVRAEFGADPRVRYITEPRPGLSYARNRGVTASAGQIVAFTDDDVRVDPYWLDGIVRGFQQDADVACVTGLIPTAEIDNAVQLYFDQRHLGSELRGPPVRPRRAPGRRTAVPLLGRHLRHRRELRLERAGPQGARSLRRGARCRESLRRRRGPGHVHAGHPGRAHHRLRAVRHRLACPPGRPGPAVQADGGVRVGLHRRADRRRHAPSARATRAGHPASQRRTADLHHQRAGAGQPDAAPGADAAGVPRNAARALAVLPGTAPRTTSSAASRGTRHP